MHIVKKIASMLDVGCPENLPKFLEEYLPLPFGKYITIYSENIIPSNHYDYFNDVIDDIYPALRAAGIACIQLLNSGSDKKLKHCVHIDKFSYPQMNYLLRNSLLHICTDAFTNDLAAALQTPAISIIGNRFAANSYAFFAPAQIIIQADCSKKPSFLPVENPKAINSIKTEIISYSILKHLGLLRSFLPYRTIFTGSAYHEAPVCDIIPDAEIPNPQRFAGFVNTIRLDKATSANKETLYESMTSIRHTLVIDASCQPTMNRPNNCSKIMVLVCPNLSLSKLSAWTSKGIPVELVYKDGLFNEELALRFIDHPIKTWKRELNLPISENMRFRTSKLIVCGEKLYPSYAHLENGVEMSTINNCINKPSFFEDDSRFKIEETTHEKT